MIFLSILTGLTSLMPILIVGIKGVFYSIDPEVMYVGNALSFIKIGQIQYIDHPGTPSILLVSLLLWPLRIFAKLISRTPFVLWAFEHYEIVFFYLRILFGGMFSFGVWIFLKAVRLITKSMIFVFFAWAGLLIFTPTLRLGSGITPETVSFLLVAIWLWYLAKFLNNPDMDTIMALGILSGVALANKFTNLYVVMASLLLPNLIKSLNRRQKFVNLIVVAIMALSGFILGTWTIRDKYRFLFGWAIKLLTSTGIHAGGARVIFDWPSYWQSIITIHHQLPWFWVGILIILATSFFQKKLLPLTVAFIVGVLTFAKYPLTYYQLSNYVVLVFIMSFLLSKFSKLMTLTLVIFMLPLVKGNVNDYFHSISDAMAKTEILERYIDANPAKKATLWEWGRAKTPALLLTMSPDWHGSIFAGEKERLNLPAYELFPIPKEKVFDLCWDQLYIQKVSIKEFMDRYPGKSFNNIAIPGSDDMVLLTSNHCFN